MWQPTWLQPAAEPHHTAVIADTLRYWRQLKGRVAAYMAASCTIWIAVNCSSEMAQGLIFKDQMAGDAKVGIGIWDSEQNWVAVHVEWRLQRL